MDVRLTWTDCNEADDYVVPNVFSPRDLVFRPDNMHENVLHTNQSTRHFDVQLNCFACLIAFRNSE